MSKAQSTPNSASVREALEKLVRALGELPAGNLDQASESAYRHAANLLDPDEFTGRFMASARKPV